MTGANPSLPGDKPTMFESVVCTRCGGSGRYSFNTMDGSRCYGCGGRGRKLTKRGAAAQVFYRDLLSKRAADIEAGDVVYALPNPIVGGGGWLTVESARRTVNVLKVNGEQVSREMYEIQLAHKSGDPARGQSLLDFPDTKLRVAATRERKLQARDEALAYQATLTKAGTPRKRSATTTKEQTR